LLAWPITRMASAKEDSRMLSFIGITVALDRGALGWTGMYIGSYWESVHSIKRSVHA
jgi:hypothetical protein